MTELLDAPRIREAETYGIPDIEDAPVKCPVCGNPDVEDFWIDINDNICGCNDCMKRKDAFKWMMEHRQ